MNKIYSEPIAKAREFAEGVKKASDVLLKKGVQVDTARLEELCNELEKAGLYQDEVESKLKEARSVAHSHLVELKELYAVSKEPVKQNFPQQCWLSFGLTDKK